MEFNNKIYAEFLFTDMDTKVSQTYTYSTIKSVRDASELQMGPPTISSIGIDSDRDGVYEQWNVTVRVRKPSLQSALSQLNLILGFSY